MDAVCMWEVATGRRIWRVAWQYPGELSNPVAFSPDGRLVAAVEASTHVLLLDAASGQEMARLGSLTPILASWLAFSPSGTQLAVATEAHVIQLWDLRKLRQQLAELRLDWNQPPYPPAPTNAPAGPITVRVLR
jgi:WD40 repeat protein